MPHPQRDEVNSFANECLAIDGGPPAVPEGPSEWPPRDERVRDLLLAAWQDGSWGRYHGPQSEQLTDLLCKFHGVEHVLLCCSGTLAVELALRALKVGAGDEVVLAAYDFPGNFRAIEAVGATPVLVDIATESWCLDPIAFAAALGPKVRAVIVSHLHGGLADMQQIMETARRHEVRVVEDACQAPGALVQERPAGTWGDVGVLSFGGSKLLTAGRGGAILTDDASVYQRAKIYNERGNEAFPLSQLQAAVLLPQIDSLARQNQMRREAAQKLVRSWHDLRVLRPVLPECQPGLPSYYKLALRYDSHAAAGHSRDRFIDAICAEGVMVGPGFRGFVKRGTRRCRSRGELKRAADAAATTVLLHHCALIQGDDNIARVSRALRKVAWHFQRHA